MSTDRYANLTPVAVTAALRSFPRRYQAALAVEPGGDPDGIGAVAIKDGRTVRQALADTAKALSQLASGFDRVLVSTPGPTLPPVAAGDRVTAEDPGETPTQELSEAITTRVQTIADRLEDAPSADLLRSGKTTAGVKVSAIDIARQAVRVTAESLLALEHAVGKPQDPDADDD